MPEPALQRGVFYLADLNPQRGTEPGKTRPVLVVQNDLLNQTGHLSTIILPLTRNLIPDAEPLRVHIPPGTPGFKAGSDILIDQLRAIDNRRLYHLDTNRLIKRIAAAPEPLFTHVLHCLKLVLDLP